MARMTVFFYSSTTTPGVCRVGYPLTDLSTMVRCFDIRRATSVLSFTSPASCPHAASMSSPRVLRTVVTMPASLRIFANAETFADDDRNSPDAGKGLKGMRLNLHHAPSPGLLLTSATNCAACAGESFTPSSMQYSNVMKSRGA